MKKVLKIIIIFTLIIFIKLSFTYTTNELIIYNYNNDNYNTKLIKVLYLFNFYQKYIVYYNEGNILSKTNNYEKAIEKYEMALDKNPPQNKVCDICINLSLAIIKNTNSNNKTEALYNLNKAKNILYENNCASPIDETGKSKEAEKLESEIKELEEQIKNNNNSPSDNNPNEQEPTVEDFSNIEEELKKNEQNSNANRQDELNIYENMGNFDSYSGKKW